MDSGQTHSGLPEMPAGTATHAQETPKSQHNEAQITLNSFTQFSLMQICRRLTRLVEFKNEPQIHFVFSPLLAQIQTFSQTGTVFVFWVLRTCLYAFANVLGIWNIKSTEFYDLHKFKHVQQMTSV